jgi:hypothetical protein
VLIFFEVLFMAEIIFLVQLWLEFEQVPPCPFKVLTSIKLYQFIKF